jgi:hypothetical protein
MTPVVRSVVGYKMDRRLLIWTALPTLIVAACGKSMSNTPPAPDAESTSANDASCSTSEEYDFGALPVLSASTTPLPSCGAVGFFCGAKVRIEDGYSDALAPIGACSMEGTVCLFVSRANASCPGTQADGKFCNQSDLQCTCTAGQWSCGLVAVGEGLCDCPPSDAGPDTVD